MPNWCESDLYVYGEDREKVVELLAGEVDGQATALDFNKIIPMPEVLRETVAGSGLSAAQQAACDAAVKATGYRDWYDWSYANWGTKWNASGIEIENQPEKKRLKISFRTAWAPPHPVIEKLAAMFPSCTFSHRYYECGMAYKGCNKFRGGKLVKSFSGEYHGSRGG